MFGAFNRKIVGKNLKITFFFNITKVSCEVFDYFTLFKRNSFIRLLLIKEIEQIDANDLNRKTKQQTQTLKRFKRPLEARVVTIR
jgi:hypothetical protein